MTEKWTCMDCGHSELHAFDVCPICGRENIQLVETPESPKMFMGSVVDLPSEDRARVREFINNRKGMRTPGKYQICSCDQVVVNNGPYTLHFIGANHRPRAYVRVRSKAELEETTGTEVRRD